MRCDLCRGAHARGELPPEQLRGIHEGSCLRGIAAIGTSLLYYSGRVGFQLLGLARQLNLGAPGYPEA